MVTSLHIAKTFTKNPLNRDILQKLCLIAPNITTMFENNVSEYFNLDLYDEPVDFKEGIFAYSEAYQLIKINDIQNFACTDESYAEQFLSYKEYKKL